MNIIQTAVSQPDEIKPDRQRIMLSDRSREIIRLFEELERKRHQQAEMNETRFFRTQRRNATSAIPPRSDIACKISHVRNQPCPKSARTRSRRSASVPLPLSAFKNSPTKVRNSAICARGAGMLPRPERCRQQLRGKP